MLELLFHRFLFFTFILLGNSVKNKILNVLFLLLTLRVVFCRDYLSRNRLIVRNKKGDNVEIS